MISNKEVKLITSLSQKKFRKKHLLFVAEGEKLVSDLIKANYLLANLYFTEINNSIDVETHLAVRLSEKELKKISFLKSPSKMLGVFSIPDSKKPAEGGLKIVLDGIQDPGNLGTIIRLCDWFGVTDLICSLDTVDCYNPKVVQATMGSLARVHVCYQDIEAFIKNAKENVYIADMHGESIYEQEFPKDAIIVMGNEGNGIRRNIKVLTTKLLAIPKYTKNSKVESLNVAMATAIVLSEFRR